MIMQQLQSTVYSTQLLIHELSEEVANKVKEVRFADGSFAIGPFQGIIMVVLLTDHGTRLWIRPTAQNLQKTSYF